MNVIISFAGLGENLGIFKNNRPYPLQRLAGSTILGHVLAMLQDVLENKFTIILEEGGEPVSRWAIKFLPGVSCRIVEVGEGVGPLSALIRYHTYPSDDEILFVFGNYLVEADYRSLVSTEVDAACLITKPGVGDNVFSIDEDGYFLSGMEGFAVGWTGVCWFRRGKDLKRMLESPLSPEEDKVPAFLIRLLGQGLKIKTQEAFICLDSRSTGDLLHANESLLKLGHGSENAIERSYAETSRQPRCRSTSCAGRDAPFP